jgi:hypothetical protein
MQNVNTWNVEKWLFILGGLLCLGEWLNFSVELLCRWHVMNPTLHREAMTFAVLSLCLLVLLPNKKTRWLIPLIAALFFATAASLALRSF